MTKFQTANITLIGAIALSIGLKSTEFDYWLVLLMASILIYVLVVSIGAAKVKWQFFMPISCWIPNKNNGIVLSFDDGPQEKTSAILDLLQKYQMVGNFFCIGSHLDKNPRLAKRLVNDGHFIGNHSFTHTNTFPLKSKKSITDEFSKTNQVIEKYTGKPCRFFRPPFGVTNPNIAKAAKKLNLTCIGWSIRSFDTMDQQGEKALEKIKKNLKPGDIVLLHDHSPQILFILEQLLKFLKTNNFKTQRIDTFFKENKTG